MIPGLRHKDLQISVTQGDGAADGVVSAEWTGACDFPEPTTVLSPFLEGLAEACVAKRLKVDLRRLQFMNSATVAPILKFIRRLDRLGIEATLLYDGSTQWQRVHFNSMKVIVSALAHITVELQAVG